MAVRYTRAFPEFANGWIILARVLGEIAKYREAEAALRQAGRLMPVKDRSHVAVAWGRLCREKGDRKGAERWYRKAVALSPSTTNHIFLGATLARQGKFAEAKRHHKSAIAAAQDPARDSPEEAHYNLGLILRAEGRYKEAILHLKEATRIDRKYSMAKEALRDVEGAIRIRRAG